MLKIRFHTLGKVPNSPSNDPSSSQTAFSQTGSSQTVPSIVYSQSASSKTVPSQSATSLPVTSSDNPSGNPDVEPINPVDPEKPLKNLKPVEPVEIRFQTWSLL